MPTRPPALQGERENLSLHGGRLRRDKLKLRGSMAGVRYLRGTLPCDYRFCRLRRSLRMFKSPTRRKQLPVTRRKTAPANRNEDIDGGPGMSKVIPLMRNRAEIEQQMGPVQV